MRWPRLSQSRASSFPNEDFPAGTLLEQPDLRGHGRLGFVENAGRGGEAAGLGDRYQRP